MPWLPNAPNPGSDEALDMGCTCAVLDNDYGNLGWWWITEGCLVHDVKEEEPEGRCRRCGEWCDYC